MIVNPQYGPNLTEVTLDGDETLFVADEAEGAWIGPFDTRGDAIEFVARAEEAATGVKQNSNEEVA